MNFMAMNKTIKIPVENVGQAYLKILRSRGIKYFFGNSGTDFGLIIESCHSPYGSDSALFPSNINWDLSRTILKDLFPFEKSA
jgi:hypothetical protein